MTLVVLVLVALAVPLLRGGLGRRSFGSSADRVTFVTLHEASLAAPPLRSGLTSAGATRAARHLRNLLGTRAVAITDGETLLAWDGSGEQQHAEDAVTHARKATADGHTQVLGPDGVICQDPDCPIRIAVVAPLTVEDRVVGSLAAYGQAASTGLVRATNEVARWVSTQLELAELESSRTRLVEAEVRALRAQISPHFVYNSLTAIASFVRTDPERARDLLLEFADFTRYSFRRHGEFTTLAEELRSIDRYLLLERARFGDRLQVTRAGRTGGAPGVGAVPLHPAAGGERRPARPRGQGRPRAGDDPGPRPGQRGADLGRGRRRRHRSGRCAPHACRVSPTATASASGTSTSDCARCTATSTAWSSRPPPAPGPR